MNRGRGPAPRDDAFYYRIITFLSWVTRPLVKVEVRGLEHLPKTGPVIIAPNHVALLDPVLLGVAFAPVRPVRALAKRSLFKVRGLGGVLRRMGHIPVDRGGVQASASLTEALAALERGEAIAIYPEGTIPAQSGTLGPAKTGVARLALASGAVVVPVSQAGAELVFPKGKKFLPALLHALRHRSTVGIVVGEALQWEPPMGVNPSLEEVPIALAQASTKLLMEAIQANLPAAQTLQR